MGKRRFVAVATDYQAPSHLPGFRPRRHRVEPQFIAVSVTELLDAGQVFYEAQLICPHGQSQHLLPGPAPCSLVGALAPRHRSRHGCLCEIAPQEHAR